MKQLITMSVLAAGLLLASNQQASAWSNIKFGAGVNLHWQSGDNNLLWGFFRNGQIPGPGPYAYGPGGHHGGGGMPMYYEPTAGPAGPQAAMVPPIAPAPAPTGVHQANYANPYGYQPVGYYPQYQVPMYTPNYQVPSYWYGQ